MTVAAFLTPEKWLKSDGGPRYVQLHKRLCKGVVEGVLAARAALPPERDIAQRCMAAASVWLERGIFTPSVDEVLALALGQDVSVSRIVRLRLADDTPIAIARAALPTEVLPNPLANECQEHPDILEVSCC